MPVTDEQLMERYRKGLRRQKGPGDPIASDTVEAMMPTAADLARGRTDARLGERNDREGPEYSRATEAVAWFILGRTCQVGFGSE